MSPFRSHQVNLTLNRADIALGIAAGASVCGVFSRNYFLWLFWSFIRLKC